MYISDIRPHQIQNVGSLNLAVGVSQNHHAVDLRKRWEKTNKNFTSYKMIIRFVFYFPVRLLPFRRRFFFVTWKCSCKGSIPLATTTQVGSMHLKLFFFFFFCYPTGNATNPPPTTYYPPLTTQNPSGNENKHENN